MILNCHQRCRNAIFHYEASRGIFHVMINVYINITVCVLCYSSSIFEAHVTR